MLKYQRISYRAVNYFLDGSAPIEPRKEVTGLGSSFAYGANIFLTAAHLLDTVVPDPGSNQKTRLMSFDVKVDGVATTDDGFYLRDYDAVKMAANLASDTVPANDLAYVTAPVSIPKS